MRRTTLLEERTSLLKRIEKMVSENPKIKAYFLGGSLAKDNADEFSDIDFRLVLEERTTKREVLAKIIGAFEQDIAFVETIATFYAVIHFSNFIKVDIFAYYPHEIIPNVWLKDILILKDDRKLLHSVKEKSNKLKYQVTQEAFDHSINKYASYLHELYRRLRREEYSYSKHCTLMMKHLLISFWLMEKEVTPNDLGDWSKYEGKRSKLSSTQKELISQYTRIPFTEIHSFTNQMTYEILQSAARVADKYRLHFDKEKYQTIFSMVTFEGMNEE